MVQESERQESLGQFLKRQRELREVSLEEISTSTKVNISLLRALEKDECEKLPSPPFVRGYLKAYAQYVGLDVYEVLNRFQENLEEQEKPDTHFAPAPPMDELSAGRTRKFGFLYWALFGVIIIGVVLLAQQVTKGPSNSTTQSVDVASSSTNTTEIAQSPAQPLPTLKPQRLQIQTTKPVWMKVKIDDNPIYVERVLANREVSVNAKHRLQVYFSDRKAVKLTLNDAPVESFKFLSAPIFLDFPSSN